MLFRSDIMQDIYLNIYDILVSKGTSYINDKDAFVIQVAKTKLYKYYQKLERTKKFCIEPSNTEQDQSLNEEWDNLNNALENKIEEYFVNKDTLDSLWQYILTKSSDIQRTFYLYYFMDMPIKNIALTMSKNESTVKNWIYRTTKEIRSLYNDGTI